MAGVGRDRRRVVRLHAVFLAKKPGTRVGRKSLRFSPGQLKDPHPLFQILVNEKKDDLFQHRLALAAVCVPEVSLMTDRSYQAVIARITNLAVPAWFAHTKAGTSAVVPHLTRALPALGQANSSLHGTTLLDWLCRQLREPRHDLQSSAAEALGHMGHVAAHSHTVLTALGDTIQGQDTFVAAKAVEALRRMGSVATRHSSILRILAGTALTTSDWFVRAGILRVFQQMGSAAVQRAEILPMFVAALHNEQASIRANAVEVLGQLPLSATQILTVREALVGLLDDQQEQDESVRTEAKTALDHLNQTAVGPVATPPISSGQRLRSNARQETDDSLCPRYCPSRGGDRKAACRCASPRPSRGGCCARESGRPDAQPRLV